MSLPLPRLLDAQLREKARLHPAKLALTLDAERISTALLTLPEGEEQVAVGDWVELFVPGRSAGVFRAYRVQRNGVTGSQRISLEHGLAALGDTLVPGTHDFLSWNEDNPGAAITGYAAIQEKSNSSGSWFGIPMSIVNRDGSRLTLLFRSAAVLPVAAVTEQGWHIPVSRQLISAADQVTGDWDGMPAAGVISSDVLTACVPYLDAVGVTLHPAGVYRRASYNYTNRTGLVPKDTQLVIRGKCTDRAGNGFYAVAYQQGSSRASAFLLCSDVAVSPGYLIGGPDAELPNYMQSVAGALMAAAHRQDHGWTFGESDFAEQYSYHFEDANLLEALLSLPRRLSTGYLWETDQRTVPWRLNLRRLNADDLTELRLSRNLCRMSVTMDASGVVTGVLPIGRNGLTVEAINDGQRIVTMQDEDTSGPQAETVLHTDDDTPQALYESAVACLQAHSQPAVGVTLSALDLSDVTGEPLDALRLGKMCRVILPEERLTVMETITRLDWPDVYGAPEQVSVTLANRPDTASAILADLMRR